MTLDLTKLTPAPWDTSGPDTVGEFMIYGPRWAVASVDINEGTDGAQANCNAEFITLARNAFDVMMRRGWWPVCKFAESDKFGIEWWMAAGAEIIMLEMPLAKDPYTAIVEADRWYREHVEGKPCES